MKKQKAQQIIIGPVTYTLAEVPKLPDYAFIDVSAQTIAVRKDLPKDVYGWALWHEVIHALLYSQGHVDGHDEKLVDALAHGILQALRDNPQLRDL